MPEIPPRFKTPPPRKAESSPLVTSLLAKSLHLVGKKDNDLSAHLAAVKLQNTCGSLSQPNSGFDPEMMQAGIELAIYYIERGVRTFDAYSERIVADLGEARKPYFKSWYLAVRNWPGFDNTGMTTEAEINLMEEELRKESP